MTNDKEEFNNIVQQILGTNIDNKTISLTDKHSIDTALLNMFVGTVLAYSTQPDINLGIATTRALNWMKSFIESHTKQKNIATQYTATQFAQLKKDTYKRLMTNKKQSDLPLDTKKCAKYFTKANSLITSAMDSLTHILAKYKNNQDQFNTATAQIVNAINQCQCENGR
ncbi:MAG: hypothetical protein MJ170_04370 [Alphaproteobacteria bacterium]|nr:hypothetical protein [Alphaproteobacteria bacterium]